MKPSIKSSMAIFVVAAFAVVPSTASALNSYTWTQPTGTVLSPTHAETIPVVFTSVGHTLVRTEREGGIIWVSCATAKLTGDLETATHSNTAITLTTNQVGGNPSKGTTTGHCQASFGDTTLTTAVGGGLAYCLESNLAQATDAFAIRGGGCTEASRGINFEFDVTTFLGTVKCTYNRTAVIPVKLVATHPTSATAAEVELKGVEFHRTAGSELCPAVLFLESRYQVYREIGLAHLPYPVFIDKAT